MLWKFILNEWNKETMIGNALILLSSNIILFYFFMAAAAAMKNAKSKSVNSVKL